MATIYPTLAGNWSTRTWNDDSTGAAYGSGTPQTGDTVLCNNVAITIDASIHVATLSNAIGTHAAAGGTFTVSSSGLTVTVDTAITAAAATCVMVTPATGTTTITGSGLTVTGGSSNAARGVQNSGAGTLAITGSGTGGSNTLAFAFYNSSTGTYNVTGNATGSATIDAVSNITGTMTINGTVTGGSASLVHGATNSGSGSLTVTNATGGSAGSAYGVANTSSGKITVTGTVLGGSNATALGAMNSGTGQAIYQGAVTASATSPAISDTAANVSFSEVVNGPITNSTGVNAVTCTYLSVGQSVKWTIAKPGTPPAYSGNVTLRVLPGSIRSGGLL